MSPREPGAKASARGRPSSAKAPVRDPASARGASTRQRAAGAGRSRRAPPALLPPPLPATGGQPGAIDGLLLVDDDAETVATLSLVATALLPEMRVVGCTAPADALAKVAADAAIRVVVTDYQMEGMDGCALAKAARSMRPSLQAIVASGHAATATRKLAMAAGCFDFLAKPFTARQFATAVTGALRVSGLPAGHVAGD